MGESGVMFNLGELNFVSKSVSSCNPCDKTFFDENELDWHIKKQHIYWCYTCSTTFYNEDWDSNFYIQWTRHRMQEHSIVSKEPLNNTRSNSNEHEDNAPRDVSKLSNNKYDGNVNEFQNR